MKTTRFMKTAIGTGAALLVLTLPPTAVAYASGPIKVPCSGSGGGAAGLIAAINAANGGGGGIINLAPRCSYALSSADNGDPTTSGANGLPVITSQININGNDTTIAANDTSFRVFEVDGPGGNLTLQGLIITGGNSLFGGGILNAEGAVTLDHSGVTGNTGQMGGGGIASGVVNPAHLGPIGTLTLNFSQVNGNSALGGGGGGILNHAGTLTLNFSQVSGNTSAGGGGGIASGTGNGGTAGGSTLKLFFSQVNDNTSTGGPTAGAGGIANGGTATITLSQVNGNAAPGSYGAGILNHGTMTINFGEVNNNTGLSGGVGGGIANVDFGVPNSGVLTVNLSQVNNNSASAMGGGIFEAGANTDGTLTLPGGLLTLNLSQVTHNASASGGGIYTIVGSPVTLKLTLVAKNTPDNCFPHGSISGCIG